MSDRRDDTNPAQRWSAADYAQNARFVSDLGADILSWLAAQPGERILDLGCGDGALTEKISAQGAHVVGVDTSAEMLAAARARGLDVRAMDGEALSFTREFDAVFSNAALHWMVRADAVIAGVARALKPGGRFVAEFGGHGNIAAIVTALRAVAVRHGLDPARAAGWFYPSAEGYRRRLERHGFRVDAVALVPRPTPLPTGLRGWLATFRQSYFDAIAPETRTAMLDEIETLLAPALRDEAGHWTADYVRLKVRAQLET